MKKTFILLLAALAAISCDKAPEQQKPNEIPDDGGVSLHAVLADAGTKATNTKVGSFLWATGDALSVYDGSFHTFTLSGGAGTADGTFGGSLDTAPAAFAIYPSIGSSVSGDDVTITLPASYTYAVRGVQMPMFGSISGDDISFKHLGAILKFDVYGIPAAADKFVFNATGKKITGDFVFDSSDATPSITTEDSVSDHTVTITFSAGSMTNASFFIPVPAGTYGSGFTVALKNGESTLISKTRSSSITLSRGQLSIQSAFDCGSRTSDEIWSGTFDTGNWDRLDLRKATTWSSVTAGTKLVITLTPDNPATGYWRLKVEDGWMGELPDPIRLHLLSGQTEVSVELSEDNLAQIITRGGIYISGSYVTISSVKLVKDTREYVEHSYTIWDNATYFASNHSTGNDMAWGGFDWTKVEAGSILRLNFSLNPTPEYDGWWVLQFGKGSDWSALTEPVVLTFDSFETSVDVKLTQNNLDCFNSNSGLVVIGTDAYLTSIDLVTTTAAASETVIWTGNWECTSWNYIDDLMNDKFTWAGMSGKTVRFTLTPSASAQFAIKHTAAGWPSLTDHPIQAIPIFHDHVDITLTDDDITEISTNGGVIVSGQNYTLTKVSILK